MRKSKTVLIDGKDIQVYELSVRDIRALKDMITGETEVPILDVAEKIFLPKCVPDIKDFDDLGVSDVMSLWVAFKEINAAFLAILNAAMSEDKKALKNLFLA